MNVLIVGLGLIGGSFAKAVKSKTEHTVFGMDTNKDVIKKALSCGAIDKAASKEDIKDADITLVCLYPEQTVNFIKENAACFKKGSIVCDSCGVKQAVYNGLGELVYARDFIFIGAHPMAGKEHIGFDYSTDDMFIGASFIITPTDAPVQAVDRLREFARSLGFAKFPLCTPAEHDKMISYTSQLPHILACSYILDPLAKKHDGFSAGSFLDVTRVARINPVMWSGLFLDNREEISGEIDLLIHNLSKFKTAIENNDRDGLENIMNESKQIKESI